MLRRLQSPGPAVPSSSDPPRAPARDADDRPGPMPARGRIGLSVMLPAAAIACVLLTNGVLLAMLPMHDAGTSRAMPLVLGAALSGAALWGVGRWLARRVERIAEVLQRFEAGDYGPRVNPRLRDDVGLLAHRVDLLMASASARENRIMASALADPLTGLPNRTLFTERIRHTLAIARRTRAPFAIVVLDLDRFKFVNDTLGHAVGDRVIVEVGKRLRATVRDSDTVARVGGDEFVLLLQGGEEAARGITARIIEAMKEPMRHQDQPIDIGVSMGMAVYPEHGTDDVALMRHADSAMYRAKRRRAGVEVFDGTPVQDAVQARLSMLGDLRAALLSEQFVLDYQPKLDLESGVIVGLEAMIRWQHPTRGRLSPDQFIPFAEQTGFIRELTCWVVAEAARFAAGLEARKLPIGVSVNVSARDLDGLAFPRAVAEVLRELPLPPGRLTFEIGENGLPDEHDPALVNLRTLATLGARVAVDDYGTGFASQTRLGRLPVHELKIDRSFVTGVGYNRGNQAIVRAAIELGRRLGLRVTAEGVETVAELRMLASMGCHEIQGFLIAEPIPAADVIAWIQARRALYASSREAYFRLLIGELPGGPATPDPARAGSGTDPVQGDSAGPRAGNAPVPAPTPASDADRRAPPPEAPA
jgi:diguanylate cyclase (GGDEF)-like protein